MDIIKDPIIAGLITSAISYLYVLWLNNKKQIDREDDERFSDMRIPIILGIVVFIGLSIWGQNEIKISPESIIKIPTDITSSVMSNSVSDSTHFDLPSIGIARPRKFLETF